MGLDGQKDLQLDGSSVGAVIRLEVLEGPSGRRVRAEAERARIVAESLLDGAQVAEVPRKPGAMRLAGLLLATPLPPARRIAVVRGFAATFAPLVVEELLEERQVPAAKLEIAISDVVVRTDATIDGEQLSRVIRTVRASR
ncbi:transposase [Bradyrhizobium ottawaense]|uniref:transposase n=1 Tax=Bradyrhizobium ottawaense TaxID=931866 RepID=UPI003F9F8C73